MGQTAHEKYLDHIGKQLLWHKYLYYIKGEPILTDARYDAMEAEYLEVSLKVEMEPIIHLFADWGTRSECSTKCTLVDFPFGHPWAELVIKFDKQ